MYFSLCFAHFMKFLTPLRTLLTVAFRLRMRRSMEGTTT